MVTPKVAKVAIKPGISKTRFFGLFAQKKRWGLTWKGWIGVCIILVAGFVGTIANIYQFLSVNDPVRGNILVVEGWLPDYALQRAVHIFERRNYRLIVTTGGPLERGSFLIKYKTYAQLAKSTMLKLGVAANEIVSVPAPKVRKDRTYESALALKKWLRTFDKNIHSIDILTLGPHARRSRLLFRKAMGPFVKVGVIDAKDESYNPDRWWRYSAGVRSVIEEAIYIYAKFVFST